MDKESAYNDPTASQEQNTLVCFEYCGLWELSVESSVKEPKKWFINVEGPHLSLPLELLNVHVVRAMVDYLETGMDDAEEAPQRLRIGRFQGLPVYVRADDEYPERCFLVVGEVDKSALRFKLADEDFKHFLHASKNVLNNLEHDGLL